MRAQGGGRIVNISSVGGKVAVPHLAPYCASKFALTGLSDALRAELAQRRIYVTTVTPGLMRTGSHPNVWIKGRHEEEYAWFSLSLGTPGLSMNADRAARRIVRACQRGERALELTLAAKLAMRANALAPSTMGAVIEASNRLLPPPGGASGDLPRSGWRSQSRLSPSLLTRLADREVRPHNETRGVAELGEP
jgi:short-subunit dehydrogenase